MMYALTFLNSVLNITADEYSYALVEKVTRFLSTHFIIEHGKKCHLAVVTIIVSRTNQPQKIIQTRKKGKGLYIRKSASDFFSIFVEKQTIESTDYFYSKEADVLLIYNKTSEIIEVYCALESNQKEEMILIELVRDLVLKNEELKGSVVLHSAGAEKNGEVILITGPKGAGKSTLLLELVQKHGYRFFSGDKTFLFVKNNRLMAKGWPDYPHFGLGTISKYPKLVTKLSLEQEISKNQETIWSTKHKIPISPDVLADFITFSPLETIAEVKKIILPNIQKEIFSSEWKSSKSINMIQDNIEIVTNHWNVYFDMTDRTVYEKSLKQVLRFLEQIPMIKSDGKGNIINEVSH